MHNTHPHFYVSSKRLQASYDFISRSFNYAAQPQLRQERQPLRLMPNTVDEKCADADIFASARNTVRACRGLVSSLTISDSGS